MINQLLIFTLLLILILTGFAEAESAKDIIEKRCNACHDLNLIYDAKKNQAEWKRTIDRMIDYGAKLDKKEREAVINFLSGK